MWMKGRSVDRPCIRIQRGGSLASPAKYAQAQGAIELATERRGSAGMGLHGSARKWILRIHPLLVYTAPKKNNRANTFLNKSKALEVEAHWGHEVAPL